MTRDQSYPKNLVYIIHLDKRLHRTEKRAVIQSKSEEAREVNIDNFTDEILDAKETEELLRIIQKDELLLYPIGTNNGVSRVYRVARIDDRAGVPGNVQEILRFRQRQLPEQYCFENLSRLFCYTTGPHNKKPAVII